MAIELHHLNTHGMMEEACNVLDGVVRLKARIAELEKENAELKEQYRDMDVTHTVHIAKMNALIEELEESQRWRKFSEEKPSEEGYYLICGSSGFRTADKWTYCKDRQKMDFSFYSYGVKYWMPLPSAPKEGE